MEMEPIKLQDPKPSQEIDFNTTNSKSKTGSSFAKEKNVPQSVSSQTIAKEQEGIFIRTNATSAQLELDSKPESADQTVGKMKYGL